MIGDVVSIEVSDNSTWISKTDNGGYKFEIYTRECTTVEFELTRDEAFAIIEEMRRAFVV
jgi:hypothetical protein